MLYCKIWLIWRCKGQNVSKIVCGSDYYAALAPLGGVHSGRTAQGVSQQSIRHFVAYRFVIKYGILHTAPTEHSLSAKPQCFFTQRTLLPSQLIQLIALKLDLINFGILRMWNLIINKIWPDCTIGRWLRNINVCYFSTFLVNWA